MFLPWNLSTFERQLKMSALTVLCPGRELITDVEANEYPPRPCGATKCKELLTPSACHPSASGCNSYMQRSSQARSVEPALEIDGLAAEVRDGLPEHHLRARRHEVFQRQQHLGAVRGQCLPPS